MDDHDAPPLVEDSHLTIGPIYPLSVKAPLFGPVQTLVTSGERMPPTTSGDTVTVTVVTPAQPLLL